MGGKEHNTAIDGCLDCKHVWGHSEEGELHLEGLHGMGWVAICWRVIDGDFGCRLNKASFPTLEELVGRPGGSGLGRDVIGKSESVGCGF
ncbi:hypothetical protein P167DRAFT_531084 [Morchella conica CCBAS932]|uniref:Uncharacterized protein n=1 Tax=Morchella conica CCBAS932 TaxID=1392247 RepID=A0A3N4L3M3_9PEZI|nr:hypothetical protein P167DRAFT_531084 [Morchella conica CCBAS932]